VLQAMAVDDDLAGDVASFWQAHGYQDVLVVDDSCNSLCDAVVRLGARRTVDEARMAVQNGAGSHVALEREVLPWARRYVEASTRHVQAHGQWTGGLDEGQPASVNPAS
jgi:hypothetical protein